MKLTELEQRNISILTVNPDRKEVEQRDISILTVNPDRKEVNYNRTNICKYNEEVITLKIGHKKIGGMLV